MWDGSILQAVPGLRIAVPRDGTRLAEVLREAVAVTDGPTVLRFHGKLASGDIPAVGKLGGIIPGQAQSLLKGSLTTLTHNKGTGAAILAVGTLLALWSLTGAMQNVMWGLNVAYEREESRGFLRRIRQRSADSPGLP